MLGKLFRKSGYDHFVVAADVADVAGVAVAVAVAVAAVFVVAVVVAVTVAVVCSIIDATRLVFPNFFGGHSGWPGPNDQKSNFCEVATRTSNLLPGDL